MPMEQSIQGVQITAGQALYERRVVGAFILDWNRRL